ncbi:MAG: D-glycero-beta-D-manno-heptose 1,7-bisphosphate 7-phosphatase [Pseudomonadales bacterium]
MTRLILIDRDGVINRDSPAFVKSVSEFVPLDGAIDAIARLHRAGFKIGICTNQSGVGRGLLTEAVLADIHAELVRLIEAAGGRVDALRYCPHPPDAGCECRKPKPGMLAALMSELGELPEHTVFVGDSIRDVEAAVAAGCAPVLVLTGNGREAEGAARRLGVTDIHEDLAAFADRILRQGVLRTEPS